MEIGFTHPECSTNPNKGVEILGQLLKVLLPESCFQAATPTTNSQEAPQHNPQAQPPTPATASAQNWENA
eukprot:3956064-Karenia_brevis.AAC.1